MQPQIWDLPKLRGASTVLADRTMVIRFRGISSITCRSTSPSGRVRNGGWVWGGRGRPPYTLQLAHLGQELAVSPRLGQPLNEQLHGLNRRQRVQHLAEHPNPLQVFFWNQQLFFARARTLDIDSRKRSLVDQFAVENNFRVAGAFEFFKDHVVHARAGVDECRRYDGRRAAFFDVAGCSKETFWAL